MYGIAMTIFPTEVHHGHHPSGSGSGSGSWSGGRDVQLDVAGEANYFVPVAVIFRSNP